MATAKKILLADDDAEDREIIEDSLETLGMGGVTQYAINGEEALAFLATCTADDDLPSLIILDLNMPLLNGTQTLRAIKKDNRYCKIPVYIYSTSINPIERDQCLLMGAQDYIVKPTSYADSLKTAQSFKNYCLDKAL